jgi:dTDP-4-amino-4,6-dideoxygalactose transaminase
VSRPDPPTLRRHGSPPFWEMPMPTEITAVWKSRYRADSCLLAAATLPPCDTAVRVSAPALPPAAGVLESFRILLEQSCLTNGRFVEQFEQEAAQYLQVPECVAVSSCTSGLMLLARCLGLKGEVILPSFTFCASGHALLWNGLTPVFADCDPAKFNVDPSSVERCISSRTAALLAVHIFGCPAPVCELEEMARRRRIPLIVDGAHAFGARVGGRSVAAWGDATVFSLSPTKPLVAGEGGLIATRDPALARKLRQGRNYGKNETYDCDVLGMNARMTEFQAALGVAGLAYVERGIAERNRLALVYRRALAAVPGLRLQALPPGARSSWKDFAIVVDQEFGCSRDDLAATLAAANIETRAYFDPPLHRQKLYRGYPRPEPLPVTERLSPNVLCLPLHTHLSDAAVEAISACVAECGRDRRERSASDIGTENGVLAGLHERVREQRPPAGRPRRAAAGD